MSTAPSKLVTPDDPEKSDAAGIQHVGSGFLNYLVVSAIVAVIIIIIAVGHKSEQPTQQLSSPAPSITTNVNTTKVVPTGGNILPQKDNDSFGIDGSPSESKYISDGYYTNFICDQPYQVIKANGDTVNAEAFKCANIGLFHAEESNENKILRFRTRNNTTTKMIIEYTPMILSNPVKN